MNTYPSVTDYDIQALVDNELQEQHQERVRLFIQTNPQARQRYQELCRQKEILQKWWAATQKN